MGSFTAIWNYLFAWLFIAALAMFQLSRGYHHYRGKDCKFRLLFLALTAFSSEGSFTCYTCWDTGHRFIRSHPKDPHQRPTAGLKPATKVSDIHVAAITTSSRGQWTRYFPILRRQILSPYNMKTIGVINLSSWPSGSSSKSYSLPPSIGEGSRPLRRSPWAHGNVS
jgi:hypothetical protein